LAEGVNRKLKAALKIFHHKTQMEWDEDLPLLSMAFNKAIHESTKMMPDKLFLGREMMCPLGAQWDLASINASGCKNTNQSFWTTAYQNLKQACKRVARRFNEGRRPHSYRVGDTVMYRLNLSSSKRQRNVQLS
jgi:hypothetical protein